MTWLKPKASTVFQVSFLNAKHDKERKTLIKMVKIWDLFISKRLLQPILDSTDFKEAYYRLLTKKDKEQIYNYKFGFRPDCLPRSVEASGKFTKGPGAIDKLAREAEDCKEEGRSSVKKERAVRPSIEKPVKMVDSSQSTVISTAASDAKETSLEMTN